MSQTSSDVEPEPLLRFYKVICPKCRAMPGKPCHFGRESRVDLFSIHIARIDLYEAYALGSVNELGVSNRGQIVKYDGNIN